MPVEYTDMLRRVARLERALLLERVRRIYMRLEDRSLSIPLRTAKELERLHAIVLSPQTFHFQTLCDQLDAIEAVVGRASTATERRPT